MFCQHPKIIRIWRISCFSTINFNNFCYNWKWRLCHLYQGKLLRWVGGSVYYLLPTKVMFSRVSICHSVLGGDAMWPLPIMHWTSLYKDLRGHQTWGPPTVTPDSLLMTSGGNHWRPVQTCSSLDTPLPLATSGCRHWSTGTTGMISCYVNNFRPDTVGWSNIGHNT